MKFVGPDWKEISEDKIASRSSPGSVMPGKGIKLNETTGEISVTTGIYSITYDMDGGTNNPNNPSVYTYTSSTITLAEPTRDHYDFLGWTGSNGNTPQKSVTITPSLETSTDLEYKANWAVKTYTVSWKWIIVNLDGTERIIAPSGFNLQIPYGTSIKDAGGEVPYLYLYSPSQLEYTWPNNWVYENTETILDDNAPITSDTTFVSISTQKQIIYGYCVDENDSNPATRVTYPEECANKNFTPAGFANGVFSKNDWLNKPMITWFEPCALKFNGTVDYLLDSSDYSKKLDVNQSPSDYNNPDYEGNMMVRVKKMYTKRLYDSTNKKRYFYVSNVKADNDFECDAFINKYGEEQDYIYLPLFKGSVINGKLRSIAGQTPSRNTTTEQEVNYAAACGDRWQIWDFSSHELVRDLCTLISKSTDSQTGFGRGYCDASRIGTTGSLYNTNAPNDYIGGFYGSKSSGTVHCKVFHIEDFWGNRYDRMLGLILSSFNIYTKGYPPYSYTSVTDYTNQGSCGTISAGGYYKTALWTRNGQIPTWTGGSGSSSTYECDRTYFGSGTANIAIFGGGWGDGSDCGSGFVHLGGAASNSYSGIGGSPLYK